VEGLQASPGPRKAPRIAVLPTQAPEGSPDVFWPRQIERTCAGCFGAYMTLAGGSETRCERCRGSVYRV
jgi:hypothetical protein